MRVLHSSDLHGDYKALLGWTEPFDVWVDTGDFFPNRGRVARTGHQILDDEERRYQLRWLKLKELLARLAAWLGGRPLVSVPGNHDFLPLAAMLRAHGADAHAVTPAGVDAAGLRWAGFREIPWIDGEWPGEARDFDGLVDATWAAAPDVLVTHAPAAGILDGNGRYGVGALADALASRPHRIRMHLFGHEHEDGGRTLERAGVLHANGAKSVRLHELRGG